MGKRYRTQRALRSNSKEADAYSPEPGSACTRNGKTVWVINTGLDVENGYNPVVMFTTVPPEANPAASDIRVMPMHDFIMKYDPA
jgi:hypothetical protein